jgi:hypothetical protein
MKFDSKDILINAILLAMWTFITTLIINTSNVRTTRYYIFVLLAIQLIISKFIFQGKLFQS